VRPSDAQCAARPENAGKVYCLDEKTGKPHWIHETNSETWSTPLVADGKVYVCTKSKLITFAAGKERKVLSEVLLGSSAYSTPVAANGTLFVCSWSYIRAVQKGREACGGDCRNRNPGEQVNGRSAGGFRLLCRCISPVKISAAGSFAAASVPPLQKNCARRLTNRLPHLLSAPTMSTNLSSLDRIADLKAQIAAIEQGAIRELMEKRNTLSRELAAVDAEIARLTGKPVDGAKPRASAPKAAGKSPSLQELKAIIAADPEKTLNIRKGGYDLRNIKVLAQANPGLLQLGGKGAWPTVKLMK